MSSTVIVFPGMGPSSFSEVGKFMTINPFARRRLAEASEALGFPVLERFRSTDEAYNELTQAVFVINSLALADWAHDNHGITPDVVVGPSFGERALAAYSGSLSFGDLLRLTSDIARVEAEHFAEAHQDVISQFVTRTPQARLNEILAELTELGEWHDISAYFDEDVHLISLREHNLEWFKQKVREGGGYSLTTMKPPAHTSILEPLRARLAAEVFPHYDFADPRITVVSDQDGRVLRTGEEIRTLLIESVTAPVHWGHVATTFHELGVTKVCVAGPDFLVHRLKGIGKNFEVVTASPKDAMKPRKPVRRVA